MRSARWPKISCFWRLVFFVSLRATFLSLLCRDCDPPHSRRRSLWLPLQILLSMFKSPDAKFFLSPSFCFAPCPPRITFLGLLLFFRSYTLPVFNVPRTGLIRSFSPPQTCFFAPRGVFFRAFDIVIKSFIRPPFMSLFGPCPRVPFSFVPGTLFSRFSIKILF